MEWQIVILAIQVVIALVSYFTAYRNRVIYAIDTDVLRMPHEDDFGIPLVKEHINEKLKNGEHTILQIVQRPDNDVEIIYGQLKKKLRSKKSN